MSDLAELSDDAVFGRPGSSQSVAELSDADVFSAPAAPAQPDISLASAAPVAPPPTLAPADPATEAPMPLPPAHVPPPSDGRRDRGVYEPLTNLPPPASDTFTQAGNMGRVGYQLEQGWEGWKHWGASAAVMGAYRGLQNAQNGIENAYGYPAQMPPERRQEAEDAAYKKLADALAGEIAAKTRYGAVPSSPYLAQFQQKMNSGDYRGAVSTLWNNPTEIMQAATVPAVVQAAPALALALGTAGLGVVPATLGALVGSVGSRIAPETQAALARRLQERGVDLTNADAIAREMANNPQMVSSAFQAGGQAALAAGVIDAIGLRLARPIIPRAGVVRNAGALAGNLALGVTEPMVATGVGQLAGEGQVHDPAAIATAGLAGAGTAAMATSIRTVDARAPGGYRPIDLTNPGAPSSPRGVGGPPQPSAPGGAPLALLALSAPPGVASSAPGAGARPPVPPSPGVPSPAPGSGGQAVAGFSVGSPVQVIDAQTATVRPGTLTGVAPSGGGIVTFADGSKILAPPNRIMPPAAPQAGQVGLSSPAASPPVPAPPTPAEQGASALEQHLADPRTNTQIDAEKQAGEQQLLTQLAEQLPPGFTVAPPDEPGGPFSVLDPSGDWVVQLSPGGIRQETINTALGDATRLNQTVDFSSYTRVGEGTQQNPVVVQQPTDIHAAGQLANTNATDGQKDAENHAMGHVVVGADPVTGKGGLPISIQNPAGSERTGVAPDGTPWSVQVPYDRGYIKRTTGADGGKIDVFLGPNAHEAPQHPVFVIDQIDPATGKFDEHKAMIGFPTLEAAQLAYGEGFSDGSGPARAGAFTPMGWQQFTRWAKGGQTKAAVAYQEPPPPIDPMPAIKAEVAQTAPALEVALKPAEKDAAVALMLQHGISAAEAIHTVVEAAAIAAEERTNFRAPKGYDVVRAELEHWGKQLGLALTPQQFTDAFSLTLQGHTPPQAVLYAGALQPALEADASAAAALDLEREFADVGQPETSAPISRPGVAPPDQSSQPAGSQGAGAPRPAPDSEQPAQGGGEFQEPPPRAQPPRAEAPGERPENTPDAGNPVANEGAGPGRPTADRPAADEGGQADLGEGFDAGTAEHPKLIGIAQSFRNAFANGQEFKTIVQARNHAALILGGPVRPGTALAKLVDEAIELGAVMFARKVAADDNLEPPAKYDRLVHLYTDQMPRLGVRTGDSIIRQAYSTPLPLAYALSVMTDAAYRDGVYEPTAGNGALLVATPPQTAIVNELDPERRKALEALGFQPSGHDATTFQPEEEVTTVLANPPFGVVREGNANKRFDLGFAQKGYTTTQIDHAIAFRALDHMREDGTAGLILGGVDKQVRDPQKRADAYNGKMKREFFFALYNQYNVVDHFTVPGELYAGQGAAWPVDVIVIHGRGKSALPYPFVTAPRIVEGWAEIKEIMANAPSPEVAPRAGDGESVEPGSGEQQPSGGPALPVGQGDDGRPIPEPAGGSPGVDDRPGGLSDTGGANAGEGIGGAGPVGGGTPVRGDMGRGREDAAGKRDVADDAALSGPTPDRTVRRDEPAGGGGRDQGDAAIGVDDAGDTKPKGQDGEKLEEEIAHDLAAPPPDAADAAPPPTEKKPRVKDEPTETQAAYVPFSKAEPVGTLIPVNMETATRAALQALVDEHGNIDDYVGKQLDYTREELFKRFSAEQVDALAMSIHQTDRGKGFIIGDQCVAGETLIYDPITTKSARIDHLAVRGFPHVVMALTKDGFRPHAAAITFKKGRADLYRVTLADGRNIAVTRQHRFLTPAGWATLDAGVSVGTYLAVVQSEDTNSLATHGACATPEFGKPQDWLDRCFGDCRLDDAQPPQTTDSDQSASPRQGDAPAHSLPSSRLDDQGLSPGRTPLSLGGGLPAKRNWSPSESRVLGMNAVCEHASDGQLTGSKRGNAPLSAQWSDPSIAAGAQVPELERPSSESDWTDGASRPLASVGNTPLQPLPLPIWPAPEPAGLFDIWRQVQPIAAWSVVASVQFVRHDDFYDMYVPGAENYAAEGFVNHNTGVGKGRIVAGMIRYALRQGLTPIFVTQAPNLYGDMARDLNDIGMGDLLKRVLMTNNDVRVPYTEEPKGPALRSPAGKTHNAALAKMAAAGKLDEKYDAVFTTYSQMQELGGKTTDRQPLINALAPNAFIIMDESHNAGGAGASDAAKVAAGKTPRSVFVRRSIGAARSAFYSSATWAKTPTVMDLYGLKTDMADAVEKIEELAPVIARGGVPMQQIVTAQLAQVGQYMRRERSFKGVTYDLQDIKVDHKTYDTIAGVLADIFQISEDFAKPAIKEIGSKIRADAKKIAGDQSIGAAGASTVGFGGVMHNLISQMLLASKAKGAVDRAIEHMKDDKKIVIALSNTMGKFIEEFTSEVGANPGYELELNFNALLQRYLKKTLRYLVKQPFSKDKGIERWLTPGDFGQAGERLYYATQKKIAALDLSAFPVSPIDYMHAKLQEAGYKTAEITGRTEAAEYRANGKVYYRRRPGRELTPAGRRKVVTDYNSGEIDVIILNAAGATGLSLHANAPFKDRRKRVMLIAQAEANIDVFMQTLGRIHRTGQVVLPAYEQLVADVPAEKRPAAVLAMKMASLSASTTASRTSAMTSKAVDFINKYGGQIIDKLLDEDWDLDRSLGEPRSVGGPRAESDGSDVTEEGGDDTDYTAIARRVTGRIPLLRLTEQQRVYDDIERRYITRIAELDAAGENALEAKTFDFDAKVLEEHQIIEGRGKSPFTAPAFAEYLDIKRQTPPMKPDAAISSINSFMVSHKYLPVGTYPPENLAERGIAGMVEYWTTLTEAAKRVVAADMRRIATRAFESAKAVAKVDRVDPEKASPREAQLSAAEDQIKAALSVLHPGALIDVGIPGGGTEPMLVRSVANGGGENNKHDIRPSEWHAGFIDLEGRSRYLSFSQAFLPSNVPKDADDHARTVAPSSLNRADWLEDFKARNSTARDQRWVLTGNIMAAFSASGGGQIINFTDAAGAIRQGVMMTRGWSYGSFAAAQAQPMRDELATAFLQSERELPPYIELKNGVAKVSATNMRDVFLMEIRSSRRDGSPYYSDRELAVMMKDRDFFSRSGAMRGSFAREDLPFVVRRLGKLASENSTNIVSTHPDAKGFAISGSPTIVPRFQATGEPPISAVWETGETPIDEAAWSVFAENVAAMTGYRTTIRPMVGPLVYKDGSGSATGVSAGGALIMVSIRGSVGTGWAMHHEAVHALRAYDLIQPAEWTALTKAAAREGWDERYTINVRYPNMAREMAQEEAIAEAFGEYSSKRSPMPKGMIGRAAKRTFTFFGRLKSGLQGKGFIRPEDVFERIIIGEVGKREPQHVPGRTGTLAQAYAAVRERAYWDETAVPFGAPELPDHLAIRNPDGTIAIDLMAGMSDPLKRLIQKAAPASAKRFQEGLETIFGRTSDPRITIEENPQAQDFALTKNPVLRLGRFITRPITLPRHLFRDDPDVARLIQKGIEGEEDLSRWNYELTTEYESIGLSLDEAGRSFSKVMEAMVYADAEEIDTTDRAAQKALFDDLGLSIPEQSAFKAYTKHLEKIARFFDNHRRSMLPQVKEQKARIWQRLHAIMQTATPSVDGGYGKIYRRRAHLVRKIALGSGEEGNELTWDADLAAMAQEVDEINTKLRRLRLNDPVLQARMNSLQDDYDALEGRLMAVQVRGRRKGYIRHLFFGSWRLHVWEPETEDANGQWREITSDQGFYDTKTDVLRAAKKHLKDHPNAQMRVQPRMVSWPAGMEATELTDNAFYKLRGEIEDATGLEGEDLSDAMRGIARKRNRRRLLSAARYRTGHAGYSKDMDRVFRTHISQAVRYVVFDKLKFEFVTVTEKAGLSRNRGATVQERSMLQRDLDAWWNDLNGGKQDFEASVDHILQGGGIPGSVLMAGAAMAGGALLAGAHPIAIGALGLWAGQRMYKAVKKGGDFPLRTFQSSMVGDMAHLKLGMLANVHSPLVNLTQTLQNTYPVLKEKYTSIGIQRAIAALWAQSINENTPDAILLRRAGVRTQFHMTDQVELGAGKDPLWQRMSMLGFNSAETFNRAVAFLGAYHRAKDAGKSEAQAMKEGRNVMRRTQHHYGNADKAMILRQQWARMPFQFANYALHQIGLAFELKKHEVVRFLGVNVLLAGMTGFIGMQALDLAYKALSGGNSLITEIKHTAVRAAKEYGTTAGNILLGVAYGVPGYLGAPISNSVGMGEGFLKGPSEIIKGPTFGTIINLGKANEEGAGLVDQLAVISPAFKLFKALETAADGNQMTSGAFWNLDNWQQHRLTDWRHRGALIYHPTKWQIMLQGAGFSPIEEVVRRAEYRRILENKANDQGKADSYLARIVEARRSGRSELIPGIRAEARAAKVHISSRMVQNAIKASHQDLQQRGIRLTPRRDRPNAAEDKRTIDNMFR